MTTESYTASPGTGHSFGVSDDLKGDAGRLKHSIEDRAKQEAETRKGQAADALGSASEALGNAADELERNADAPDWLASAVKQAAGKIDAMAGQIQGRTIDEIGQTVASFARKNPGAFLAASAAAGFAAARVLRAGVDKSHQHHNEGTGNSQDARERTDGTRNNRPATGGADAPGGLAERVERDVGGVAP